MHKGAILLTLVLGIGVSLVGCRETLVREIVERGAEYNLAYTPSDGYNSDATTSSSDTSSGTSLQAGTDLSLDGLRDLYDDTSDDQNVTVMMYFIGSDLESSDGSASDDIKEMLRADIGDNVNVVLETGGSDKWFFSQYLDPETPQRWVIDDDKLRLVGQGQPRSMTDKSELSEFVSWAARSYPADRYILILWDHGGGTVTGYGWDEIYTQSDPMSVLDLQEALVASGVKFNFVGYDACLLGTLEMAYAMEPVADYLIASEEYEPGLGWSYQGFLSALSENPSIATPELAETIVGDFIDDCEQYGIGDLTLSCVDLREVDHVYEQLTSYFANVRSSIEADNGEFANLSRARSSAKEFDDGDIDQIDIIDFVSRTDYEGAEELIEAIDSAVKYRGSSGISGAYGLAMYFPYSSLSYYESTSAMLGELGFSEPLSFYEYFLALMNQTSGSAGSTGQSDTSPSLEEEDFSYEETVVTEALNEYGEIPLSETNEGYELALTDAQWDTIASMQIQAALVSDESMIYLGNDSFLSYTSSGNPLITTGGRWLGINGSPVMFESHPYEVRDEGYYYSGSISALLNGTTRITIEVAWPILDAAGNPLDGSPNVASVLGYRRDEEQTDTVGRGYRQFHPGDSVAFLLLETNLDSDEDTFITLSPAYVVRSQSAMNFSYIDLYDYSQTGSSYDIACWGTVSDIYQNTADTEIVWE